MTHRGIPRKQKHNSKKVLLLVYKKVVFTVCVCLMHKALVFEFHLGDTIRGNLIKGDTIR